MSSNSSGLLWQYGNTSNAKKSTEKNGKFVKVIRKNIRYRKCNKEEAGNLANNIVVSGDVVSMQCELYVHMSIHDAKMDLFSHHGLQYGKFCDTMIADRVCASMLD